MSKMSLSKDLIMNGFEKNYRKNFQKDFNGVKLEIEIYSFMFGIVSSVGIIYNSPNPKDLSDDLIDLMGDKIENVLQSNQTGLELGAWGGEFIELSMKGELNAQTIERACLTYVNLVYPILKEFGL